MTAPIRKKHIVGEYMTSRAFALMHELYKAYTHKELHQFHLTQYSFEELYSIKELLEKDQFEGYCDIIDHIELREIERIERNGGFRDTPYECLPMRHIDGGCKRLYVAGQWAIHNDCRVKMYIDNDYVLTNDDGICIGTKEVLPREFLISLDQKQIQGSSWTLKKSSHIFLPIPRDEAKRQGLRFVKDKHHIAQYYTAT